MTVIRRATRADISVLSDLIERSMRGLQHDDYTLEQIDGALATVYGVDTTLIDDGTYLAVEVDDTIVACGGWSKRKTLYGGDVWAKREDEFLDPAVDAAKIRAFFVSPEWARRGFGTLLLDACEKAARDAGFHRFEMGATLTGVRLYERRGTLPPIASRSRSPVDTPLPVMRMIKDAY